MAVVEGVVRFCDRDDRRAVTSKRFSFDGRHFQLDVCPTHLEMFERDMTLWSRRAMSGASDPTAKRRTCCLDEHEPTASMRLTFSDTTVLAGLCAEHRRQFVEDMLSWAHYGEELTLEPAAGTDEIVVPQAPGFAPAKITPIAAPRDRSEVVPGTVVRPIVPMVRQAVRDAAEETQDEESLSPVLEELPDLTGITESTMREWTFTRRAHDDMDERGVSPVDVWRVLDSHGKQVRPGRDPSSQVWEWKGLAVVVAPREKKVITVMVYRQRVSRPLTLTGHGV
jgi:hypothetical protein